MSGITTVSLKKPTKARLDRIGNKGESYDDIVNKAIDGYLKSPLSF